MSDPNQLGSIGVSAGGYATQGAPPGVPVGFQPPPQQQSQVQFQQPTGYGKLFVRFPFTRSCFVTKNRNHD